MGHMDAAGLPLTLEDKIAVSDWNTVVTGFLSHSAATPRHLDAVLLRAPHFALAWAAKGMFCMLLGRSELKPVAAEALERAHGAVAAGRSTWREARHVDALAAFVEGRPSRAAQLLDAILERYPRDSLAMKLNQAIRFVLGDSVGMLRSQHAVIGSYGPDHVHSGYAMGCMAFALEECGAYPEAERWGRAGIERAPDDAWGLHAVAHVLDMTGRSAEGIAWLAPQVHRWAHCNNFGYHVWWHLALFHLDRGAFDRVLELYDTKVRAEHTDDYRDIANGASMLVRLEIEGLDVGDRWEELAELAAGRVEDGAVVFADLHYLLALHGGARNAEADRLVARIARDAQGCDHDMHEVAAVAGFPTAQGLAAFRAGNYDLAFERLAAAQPQLQRIGGSHAQRDVFSRLWVEAGLRAGRWQDAERALLARASRRGAEDGFTGRRREAIARHAAASLAAE